MEDDKAHRTRRLIAPLTVVLVIVGAGSVAAQQARDDVTTVSPVEVRGVGSGVPIPHVGQGAPVYTIDEIHEKGYAARDVRSTFEDDRATLYNCYESTFATPPNPERMIGYEEGADAARRLSTWARTAETATQAAQQARIDAATGAGTMAQVDTTELDRQKAVIEMVKAEMDLDEARAKALDIQQLVKDRADISDWNGVIYAKASERAGRKYAMVPKEFEDLKLENIRAVERHDDKGQTYLFVTGSIRNTHAKKIAIPPLSLTAVDQFGYPLLAESGEARGRIDPGKSQAFTYSLKPSPANTARVIVTFAGLEQPEALYPAAADPVCTPPPSRSGRGNQPYQAGDDPLDMVPLDPRTSGSGALAEPSARTTQTLSARQRLGAQ